MKTHVRRSATAELSRRGVLSLAAGATGAALLGGRAAIAQPSPSSFVDRLAIQQIADRDPALRPPLLIDMQTQVWWRATGPRTLTDRGESFLRTLAGSRAAVVGRPVPIADMGRVMFFEDVLLESQTDVAFLNSFGMRAAFDGVDLFPPREAAFIRSMAPARVRAGLGPDNILWGTDTPVIGPPQWQIEAFEAFTIPDQLREHHDYPQLTKEIKHKILGENAARLFGLDVDRTRNAAEGDLLYKLRDDGNSPVHKMDWTKVRLPIVFD